MATYCNKEFIGIGADQSRLDRYVTGSHMPVQVTGENGVNTVQFSRCQHFFRAGPLLLGRLKNEQSSHGPAGLPDQGGGAQEHGHMAVMTAGMHDAGCFRGKGKACFFLYGQGVHVGAQGDGAAVAAG